MTTQTDIRENFKRRKLGGGLLCIIAVPLTLLWATLALPPSFTFADLILLLGGPGLLALGLWAMFGQPAPRIRITLTDDGLTLHPGMTNQPDPTMIAWQDLTGLSYKSNGKLLRVHHQSGVCTVRTYFLDRTLHDIVHLITLRLENTGHHLVQRQSPVMGANLPQWDVAPIERISAQMRT